MIIGTGVLGGAIGGLTSLGKIVADTVDKQRQRKHEEKMAPFIQQERALEMEREKFVADNKMQVAEMQQATSLADLEVRDRESARENDACKYLSAVPEGSSGFVRGLMAIVDFCRGLTRPLITWLLVIAICLQYAGFIRLPDNYEVILVINELTGACIAFWFGSKIAVKK